MAVKIKLMRLGKIHYPVYRIVVADSRTRRDGRAIETIGRYEPMVEPSLIEIDSERAQYWLGVGAQPTTPVLDLLKITGDWQKFKGLPGAEGTLRVAEPKESKLDLFNKALAAANDEPSVEDAAEKRKADKKAKAEAKKKEKAEAAAAAAEAKKEAEAKASEAEVESAAAEAEEKALKADNAAAEHE